MRSFTDCNIDGNQIEDFRLPRDPRESETVVYGTDLTWNGPARAWLVETDKGWVPVKADGGDTDGKPVGRAPFEPLEPLLPATLAAVEVRCGFCANVVRMHPRGYCPVCHRSAASFVGVVMAERPKKARATRYVRSSKLLGGLGRKKTAAHKTARPATVK